MTAAGKINPPPSLPEIPATSAAKFCFNLLPISYPEAETEMCFTPIPLEGLYPFRPGKVPKELTALVPRGRMPEYFYTNALPGGPGVALKVQPGEHPALGRLWCMQRIRRLLEPQVDYCQHTGPFTTHIWCSIKRMPAGLPGTDDSMEENDDRQAFHRFTIKVLHRKHQPHPELLIGYNGIGCILKQSLEELAGRNPDTRTIRRVAFRGHIYKWEELPEAACYHIREALPLVSSSVARWLGLTHLPASGSTKNGNCFALISTFLKTHLLTGAFQPVAPHDGCFSGVDPADTGCVPSAGSQLLFGEGGLSENPVEGMAAHGPLQLPPGSHFSCFTVCFEEDKQLALKLFEWIVNTDPSRRLGSFIRVPMRFSHDHSIFLSRHSDVEQQLERRLMELEFEEEIVWCAFFVCPAAGQVPGGDARQLHARITELLLHRGVLVQKVPRARLEGDFTESSRLLGLDVAVRLGGTPWRPEGNNLPDPVAGFAVESPSNPPGPAVGAAVFFAPGGLLAGANSFNPAHRREWGGLSMEFFRKWEAQGNEARRLVLHLPHPLKPHELASLQAMIDEGKPGLQVVLMVIRRCCSRDIRVFTSDDGNAAVPDGTWVRCSNSRYLLYTRGSQRENKNEATPAVPLTVRFRLLNAGNDTIGRLAPGLLDQLHCLTRMHRPPASPAYLPVTLTCPALLARFSGRLRNKALPAWCGDFLSPI